MTSPCPAEDVLVDYAGGMVSQRRRREIDVHLDTCEGCRAAVSALARRMSEGPGGVELDTAPENPSPVMPGRVVAGRFELEDILGVGAMGTVYRAHDRHLDEPVALKMLKPAIADRADVLEVLRREIKLSRRVSHPNVCPVFDLGVDGDLKFFTMKWVDGETLDQRYESMAASSDDAVGILKQIAAALEAAHREGVVHRDLKAANIMLEPNGRVWVTDFGLARDLESKPSFAGPVGTPAYWSPEQAMGDTATPASDIYSFGVIAYRLFTGQLPRRHRARPDLSKVPKPWRAVVARCLEDRVTDRYVDGAALVAAWAKASSGRTTARFLAWLALGAGVGAAMVGSVFTWRSVSSVAAAPVTVVEPQALVAPVLTPAVAAQLTAGALEEALEASPVDAGTSAPPVVIELPYRKPPPRKAKTATPESPPRAPELPVFD